MRQYLGEKVTFYFAWNSFYTSFLILIAIPGAILQIYIIYLGSFETKWLLV
jgi:hypothetical protein